MQKIITLFVVIFLSIPAFSQESLEEVKVVKKRKGIQKSFTVTGNTTLITSKELLKAACCNLAESFETNPSIDVNFSDALTGTKKIKMLGLNSQYLLISNEKMSS